MSESKRFISMLMDNETTMKSDYLNVKLRPITKTVYKTKPTCQMVRPPPLKDTHTITDWKVPRVPFDLYFKEDIDVDHANPRKPQKPYFRPEDTEREIIQKTRPRLVMTPAVPVDDMPEPGRINLMKDFYLSASERLLREPYKTIEAKSPTLRIAAPLPEMYAPPTPVKLPMPQPGLVSPEWRMESVSWDQKQIRTYCDPTKEFWMRRDPPQCEKCDESVAVQALKETQRKMMKRN